MPVETTTAEQMVLSVQKAVEHQSVDAFAALFAEDAIMEFPFTHPGWPNIFVGRQEIRSAMTAHWVSGSATPGRHHNVAWYPTSDPNQIIVECHLPAEDHGGFGAPALLILEVRDGLITRFRQYHNPVARAAA